MDRAFLRSSDLDRELALSDSDDVVISSSDFFNNDSDNDPTFGPNQPSMSGRPMNKFLSNLHCLGGLSDSDESDGGEVRVVVQPRPRPKKKRSANVPNVRPTLNRQVLSESDSETDQEENESEWEDVLESQPPTFVHDFEFLEQPGPKHIPPNAKDPIDFFRLFFTDVILNIFVTETNRYANQELGRPNMV